jgi:uncharacterized protein (DUF488 family)
MPFSKICPQFNQDLLKKFLKENGIYYIFMGKEFGARREDKSLYTNEGYLDFEKTSKNNDFINGMNRIIYGLEQNLKIAFMCTEKDPIDCHRNILVAYAFYKNGYQIENILSDGTVESQENLEERLLDLYFPDRFQLNLFEEQPLDKRELINRAYKLRNKDIGYSLANENEEKGE